MTRDEILALPAGLETNEIIRRVIMTEDEITWLYSTQISGAERVVEKMRSLGYSCWRVTRVGRLPQAHFGKARLDAGEIVIDDFTEAETMPLAICRAALIAMECDK